MLSYNGVRAPLQNAAAVAAAGDEVVHDHPVAGIRVDWHKPDTPASAGRTPSHIQHGPRETPVPRQAPHVQVFRHQNRPGFRRPGGDLVQEVPANGADAAMQPGQAHHGLLVGAGEK